MWKMFYFCLEHQLDGNEREKVQMTTKVQYFRVSGHVGRFWSFGSIRLDVEGKNGVSGRGIIADARSECCKHIVSLTTYSYHHNCFFCCISCSYQTSHNFLKKWHSLLQFCCLWWPNQHLLWKGTIQEQYLTMKSPNGIAKNTLPERIVLQMSIRSNHSFWMINCHATAPKQWSETSQWRATILMTMEWDIICPCTATRTASTQRTQTERFNYSTIVPVMQAGLRTRGTLVIILEELGALPTAWRSSTTSHRITNPREGRKSRDTTHASILRAWEPKRLVQIWNGKYIVVVFIDVFQKDLMRDLTRIQSNALMIYSIITVLLRKVLKLPFVSQRVLTTTRRRTNTTKVEQIPITTQA